LFEFYFCILLKLTTLGDRKVRSTPQSQNSYKITKFTFSSWI